MNHPAHGQMKPEEHYIRDPLTGAYTRGLLDSRLSEEVARSQREQGQLTVCLFDIDHFKSVNDAYGHARGDEVLVHLVQVVQASLRTSDVLFRYGGDEFVVLLPSTGRAQAEIVCQRMVQQVRSQVLEGSPPLKISISMGLAVFPEDASGGRELLQVADERNYLAKRQGRDRFVSQSLAEKPALQFDAQSRPLERDHQLGVFHQFMHRLETSRTGILRITGETGSGRTFFLNRIQQDLHARNHLHLALTPTRTLQHRPYAVFQHAQGLEVSIQAGVTGIVRQLTQAVQEQQKAGLALLIENMALLDWASRALLSRLLQDWSGPPLAIIYTQGVQDIPPVLQPGNRNEVQVVLTPLSRHAIQVWMREILRWEAPAELIDWIFGTSQGLPARVRTILQALLDQKQLLRREEGWQLDAGFRGTVLNFQHEQATPTTLPVPSTHFFGREKEWAEVNSLFEHRRLVTLVGPGGIGKTRLSIEVAELRQEHYQDGVWFVGLDSIQNPELVVPSIARVLGIKEGRRPLIEDLKDHLKKQSRLLVLDNFEQVIEAAPLLDGLLAAAPGLQMLVTSREKLNISGEQVFVVPPLGMPADRDITSEEEAYQYSAMSLFIDRARAVLPGLELSRAQLKSIQQICQQLDGLPLALELAAASLDLFSPEELAHDLGQKRLDVLTEGPRNLAERQKTLRNTISWSHHLLNPQEQWVFARMGVFLGGWSFEAAQAVCSEMSTLFTSAVSLQSTLMKLAAKSLIQFQRNQKRFSMLQTIREFAQEKLQASQEQAQVQHAHAQHFLNLGQQAEGYLVGDGQDDWLERLQINHGNLREALTYMLEHHEVLWAMQLCNSIWKFWQFKTHHQEGRNWIRQVLLRSKMALLSSKNLEERKVLRELEARLQMAGGWLANDQADHAESAELFYASLAGFREVGDRRGIGLALQGTGEVMMNHGQYPEAMHHFEESRQIMQELGDLEEYAWVTDHLGRCQQITGQLEAAEESFTLCSQLFRQLKQHWGESIATIHLADVLVRQAKFTQVLHLTSPWIRQQRDKKDTSGFVYAMALGWSGESHLHLGHFEQAREDLEEALETCNTSGFRLTRIPVTLSLLHLLQGSLEDAVPLLLSTLRIVKALHDPVRVLEMLIPMVHLQLLKGNPQKAVAYLGALSHLKKEYDIQSTPQEAFVLDPLQLELQAQLSPAEFGQHWQKGATFSKTELLQQLELELQKLQQSQ
ncbi:diguanylate cyclase [Deinococcus roseus]|uniref:GGDEF domain-containing protein n=1 Tax=Deinococcus roseus TaxID=392414 RepID=A0ABQ2CXY9_9DEIO|nr:diguanylate cyclase [Deinococcus roseus]GGJ31681.1 hypothetical protein GCM10008938_17280 [Deinococcus roseus]